MDDPELAAPVTRMIVEGRRGLPGHARRPRRGRGATGAKARFALPHHTWQRGADGNTNGPLREHFPKGGRFLRGAGRGVEGAHVAINRRPRRRLGFRTPYEVHYPEASRLP